MTEKRHKGGLLKIVILVIALFAMIIISFIGSHVGSGIIGSEPLSLLNVEAPKYHPAPEKPFHHLPITNTMITAWISIVVLGGLFFIGTRNMKLVPTGLQNFLELIVEASANFIEDPAGKKHGRWFFPVCTTIFLFIVANAWVSLMPGFETVHINGEPLFRSANTDLNIIHFC
jgi:F-type H+-transporting ATPase subunit a